jgi:hypothetical protein
MGTGLQVLLLALGVGANPPDVYTMRNRHLEIPIRVNEARRAELSELELHVSTDQGRTWTLTGRAKPDQKAFGFHAPDDGQYWFGVCSVDRLGKRDPADLMALPPALKVVIDTAHSPLQVVAADRVGEDVQLSWECADTQADPASLRLEYRAADGGPNALWNPVVVAPSLTGHAHFRPQNNGPITVRVQITDGTGAPAVVTRDLPGSATAAPAPVPMFPVPPVAAAPVPPPSNITTQANSIAPTMPPPAAVVGQVDAPPAPVVPPATDVHLPLPTAPMPPAPIAAPPTDAPTGLAPLAPARTGPDSPPRPPAGNGPREFGGPATTPRGQAPALQHVRDPKVDIDFEVERKGPSGVKKIEVYITPDDGHTWYRYTETTNVTPPLQLAMPEDRDGTFREGTFGFRLVLYSGVLNSEGPPRPGDRPDISLHVDRTAPKVELYAPSQDPNQPNALILRYLVTDANLDPRSVRLEWSQRPNSDWLPINASEAHSSALRPGVKECSWTLPPDITDSVYLRLRAADLAGNASEFVTRDPVTVDLQKPTAKVKGVLTGGPRRP